MSLRESSIFTIAILILNYLKQSSFNIKKKIDLEFVFQFFIFVRFSFVSEVYIFVNGFIISNNVQYDLTRTELKSHVLILQVLSLL